jgi:hypothetical protein
MGVVDWGIAALIVAAVAFLLWIGRGNKRQPEER